MKKKDARQAIRFYNQIIAAHAGLVGEASLNMQNAIFAARESLWHICDRAKVALKFEDEIGDRLTGHRSGRVREISSLSESAPRGESPDPLGASQPCPDA